MNSIHNIRRSSFIIFLLVWLSLSVPFSLIAVSFYAKNERKNTEKQHKILEDFLVRSFEKQSRFGDYINAAGDLRNLAQAIGIKSVIFCRKNQPFLDFNAHENLCIETNQSSHIIDVAGTSIELKFIWNQTNSVSRSQLSIILISTGLISLISFGIVYMVITSFLLKQISVLAKKVSSIESFSELKKISIALPEFQPIVSSMRILKYNLENNNKKIETLAIKERFTKIAARIAHDIKSPLSALRFAVQSLGTESEASKIILLSSKKVDEIANSLYQINKKSDGSIETLNILDLIEDIVALKTVEYPNIKNLFRVTVIGEIKEVGLQITELSLFRTLSNIVNNSIQAFDSNIQHLRISIELKAENRTLCILVKDNGPGFSKEFLDKWNSLNFNDEVLSMGTPTRGIGLTSAKQYIEASNGDISIYNLMTGSGATVKIKLPFTTD